MDYVQDYPGRWESGGWQGATRLLSGAWRMFRLEMINTKRLGLTPLESSAHSSDLQWESQRPDLCKLPGLIINQVTPPSSTTVSIFPKPSKSPPMQKIRNERFRLFPWVPFGRLPRRCLTSNNGLWSPNNTRPHGEFPCARFHSEVYLEVFSVQYLAGCNLHPCTAARK